MQIMIFDFFIILAWALLSLSCAQAPVESGSLITGKKQKSVNFNSLGEGQLTFYGKNTQASFSLDGTKLIFVSNGRIDHNNSQIYLLDLETMAEKRVTFQDGSVDSPIFSNDGKSIIYASTTDEIKESPLFIYNRLNSKVLSSQRGIASIHIHRGSDLHPYELYESSLDGEKVKRLTHSPNLDGNISLYKSNKERLFTSVRDGNLEIYSYRPHKPKFPIRLTDNQLMDDEAQFAPKSDEFVWVRYSQKFNYSQILKKRPGEEKMEISFGHHFHINPKWHPDNEFIYFSATGEAHKNFQIYAMKKDGSCKTRLTYNSFSDTHPAIDPNKKYLVFTRQDGTHQHLYRTNLKEPSCQQSTNS